MRRRLTGLLAGAGLAGIIIGLPLLLIATHNVAAPRLGWSWDGIWRTLLAPDDGTLLVTIVKIVGWISWAILTTTIAVEITSRARHLPVPKLRGLAWPQLLARGLVSAILAGFIATHTLNVTTEPAAAHPTSPAAAAPLVATAPLHAPAKTPSTAETYTVKRGDTLSEIALDELGDGHAYPRIFKASKTTVQPDGRKLTDPDLIIPGWKLTIPNGRTDKEKPATKPDRDRRDEDNPAPSPVPASPQPTVASTAPPAQATPVEATPDASGSDRVDSAPVLDDADDGWLDPPWLVAGLVGAGSLLAGALWLMLQRRRRAQFRARRPGPHDPCARSRVRTDREDPGPRRGTHQRDHHRHRRRPAPPRRQPPHQRPADPHPHRSEGHPRHPHRTVRRPGHAARPVATRRQPTAPNGGSNAAASTTPSPPILTAHRPGRSWPPSAWTTTTPGTCSTSKRSASSP